MPFPILKPFWDMMALSYVTSSWYFSSFFFLFKPPCFLLLTSQHHCWANYLLIKLMKHYKTTLFTPKGLNWKQTVITTSDTREFKYYENRGHIPLFQTNTGHIWPGMKINIWIFSISTLSSNIPNILLLFNNTGHYLDWIQN